MPISKPTTLNKSIGVDARIVNQKAHTSCGCDEVKLLKEAIKELEEVIEDLTERLDQAESVLTQAGIWY